MEPCEEAGGFPLNNTRKNQSRELEVGDIRSLKSTQKTCTQKWKESGKWKRGEQ